MFWTCILVSLRFFHSIGLFVVTSSGRKRFQFASKKITVATADCPHIPLHSVYQLIADTLSWAGFEPVNWKGKEGILTMWLDLSEAGGAYWQHLESMCVTTLVFCAVQHSLSLRLSPRCEKSSWFTGVCTWVLASSTWSCTFGCQYFC